MAPAVTARWAMTSLAFMLVLVPEPVWKMSIGNCASYWPSATASAALRMAAAWFFLRCPSARFASAAAALIRPSARMNWRGRCNPEMGKLSIARCVCAPYKASAGTCSSPMLSCSMRNVLMRNILCSDGIGLTKPVNDKRDGDTCKVPAWTKRGGIGVHAR